MLTIRNLFKLLLLGCILTACRSDTYKTEPIVTDKDLPPLFKLLSPDHTNIRFVNTLTEGLNTNVLMYEYFYNGGGVAIGDVNNDGLDDIYFTSNMETNRLYLNKGNMQFDDITEVVGVGGRKGPWKTGVTMADVNGDGLLDIYVCYSGNLHPEKRRNELFINMGTDEDGMPRFTEQAEEYGLALSSATTQTFFFDYDRDGDLDAFVLNHNVKALPELNETGTSILIKKQDALSGIRLLKNTNNYFADVTLSANLSSSSLTYGLGAGIADINGDGWTDIYVSNDYNVPDYMYINNGDGTFTDQIKNSMGHTSQFSMGNDVADINNDALPDIFTLDMLPEDNRRQKLLLAPDNYAKFDLNLRVGFHYQYMRNMLQLNNGNGTFSEVGQLSGVSNTDWSWAPLFADYDNDGWKDLFVTNGYLRDYTNMDFIKYMDDYVQRKGRLMREDVLDLVHQIPASNVVNYIYKNAGDLTFTNMKNTWGMNQPSNSNGAAYADLDNDGDLDLIVNNINSPAFIYQNEADKQLINHYLKVKLLGSAKNSFGLGTKIIVYVEGLQQYLEQMPSRGYQSSVSPILHIGLGSSAHIDSLHVLWLSGKQKMYYNIKANQLLTLDEASAETISIGKETLQSVVSEVKSPINFQHKRIDINDFKRQPLLTHSMSFSGPCMAKADVNADGLEDVYVGGSNGQTGMLFIQQKKGGFDNAKQNAFEIDKESHDTDALFFDANGDGFLDLYVCSGGYHFYEPHDVLLQDRLYLNDGKGNFSKDVKGLPAMKTSSSCVRVTDLNKDGYLDIFIGSRVVPGRYPEIPASYLLINNGQGEFEDKTLSLAPELHKLGMVTDASWTDVDHDGNDDLIVVGEWMPITIMVNENGKLINRTLNFFDQQYSGWWNTVYVNDINQDGYVDLIIGNHGLNAQCQVSDDEPGELHYKDFDQNGSVDPILSFYIQGKSYPYLSRDELVEQLGMMRQRFPDYKSYASATLKTIFKDGEIHDANRMQVNTLSTMYFQSDSTGKFYENKLPIEVQFSPVHVITSLDYNKDGYKDLLLCGNATQGRLKFGKYDANYGILLQGDRNANFHYIPQYQSGFHLKGDVRSVLHLNETLLFGINQGGIKAFTIK